MNTTPTAPTTTDAEVGAAALELLGIDSLRPIQKRAIRHLLDADDTLVVMPTGAGKSAIYELAAQFIDGPTVVVSPLLALQADQVDKIGGRDLGGAAVLNSTIGKKRRQTTLDKFAAGEIEFLYLAPEQFENLEVHDALAASGVTFVVVDEAHCITTWGHDFRPSYLHIGDAIDSLAVSAVTSRPVVCAATATAPHHTRDEICHRLHLQKPAVLVAGFDRPNLSLGVEAFVAPEDKTEAVLDKIATARLPGIVYVATRGHAVELAERITAEHALNASAYHAGMAKRRRREIQDDFMAGHLDVVVATCAFGMGIDKADVRFVYHHDAPDSLDSYYQEAGRAGRDGDEAECVFFYMPSDLGVRKFFAAGAVTEDELREVAHAVEEHAELTTLGEIERSVHVSDHKVEEALNLLEEVGEIDLLPAHEVLVRDDAPDADQAAHAAAKLEDIQRQVEKTRIDMLRGYAEHPGCRRRFLLGYFGEAFSAPCGNCDWCLSQAAVDGQATARSPATAAGMTEPFPVGSTVEHRVWGPGRVMSYEDDLVVVFFESKGYRTLSVSTVVDRGLLSAAGAE